MEIELEENMATGVMLGLEKTGDLSQVSPMSPWRPLSPNSHFESQCGMMTMSLEWGIT